MVLAFFTRSRTTVALVACAAVGVATAAPAQASSTATDRVVYVDCSSTSSGDGSAPTHR